MLWLLAFAVLALAFACMFDVPVIETLRAVVGFVVSCAILLFLLWVFVTGWRAIFFD